MYDVKIWNKRPCNLLNKIRNVFINGKPVKNDRITQIIPWFPRFYATTTTGNSQRYYRPHAWTVTFARWQRLPTEVSGCGQLSGGQKVGRRHKCVSKQFEVYYTRYVRIIHSRLCWTLHRSIVSKFADVIEFVLINRHAKNSWNLQVYVFGWHCLWDDCFVNYCSI